MIHPAKFEQKSGFDQIRELIEGRCLSTMGKALTEEMHFSDDYARIETLLSETAEFKKILESGMPFPTQDYLDLSSALNRLQTPGSWIFQDELHDLRLSLNTIVSCIEFFIQPSSATFFNLKAKATDLEIPPHLMKEINRILDEKGNIRDSASEELARIRKEIRSRANATEKMINHLLHEAKKAGWTSDNAEVTISEGRLVIPVLASHKRKIRGVVHDESATGHTVYLEPEACLEINNEIRELESAEKREIIKILTHFSDLLRPEIQLLLRGYKFLGELDFIRAKAILAIDTGGTKPDLRNVPVIRWNTARHPLLHLAHQPKGKKVVPLDIELDSIYRILIISGPNAGGKSVCLKTVCLLQYMTQCGVLPVMDPDSVTGIFQNIFLEIGDEQSLENDMSTYSSHLLNLKYFIDHGNPATLFLVDELGTGTDPSLGGALAEATIEKLSECGAFGVVTTHYSNLKLLSGKVPGIINGAMMFDTDKLQPLYKLVIGKPGSSFTFEIAHRIGFPDEVIEHAKGKTGKTHLDFERQLHEVETEKLQLEKQLKEFQVADSFLADLIQKYNQVKEDVERSRSEIIEKAKEEARNLLEHSNRMIEKTIREIKEAQADRDKTKSLREELDEYRKKIDPPKSLQPGKEASPPTQKARPAWKKGDRVSVEGRQGSGTILQLKGPSVTVDFDGLKLTTNIEKLQRAISEPTKTKGPYSSILNELNEKAVHFKLQLDVRGKSADEALQMVAKYVDDAYLLRIKEVSILHGKGEGILRKVIRDYLSSQQEIASFGDESIDFGGAGITKITLR